MNWSYSLSNAVAATAQSVSQSEKLTALPLMSKALLVTLIGLLGVFLVLALFFVTIKLMQHIKTRDARTEG